MQKAMSKIAHAVLHAVNMFSMYVATTARQLRISMQTTLYLHIAMNSWNAVPNAYIPEARQAKSASS